MLGHIRALFELDSKKRRRKKISPTASKRQLEDTHARNDDHSMTEIVGEYILTTGRHLLPLSVEQFENVALCN